MAMMHPITILSTLPSAGVGAVLATKRSRNANARDAMFQACLLRFRPIMMTTMVAIVGAVPLALSFGMAPRSAVPSGFRSSVG
jgi:multidrug efflux pump